MQTDAHAGIAAEFARTQARMAHTIVESCTSHSAKTHIKLPLPMFELPFEPAAAYAPYRRFYEAHQRDMELSIQPLRFNLRAALAKTSPALKKLAELDAILTKILQDREKQFLAKVPALLRKHFEQLFREHQQKLPDTRQDDNPAHWMQKGAWLARFCNDMQMLLLAELELRLQPTMGLIEAFKQDTQ
jgi:hypothetical protein